MPEKNPILYSIADGLGMGLGYTISLVALASIREIIGAGTWFGMRVMPASYIGFGLLQRPPGAFICLGLILALMNFISTKIEGQGA